LHPLGQEDGPVRQIRQGRDLARIDSRCLGQFRQGSVGLGKPVSDRLCTSDRRPGLPRQESPHCVDHAIWLVAMDLGVLTLQVAGRPVVAERLGLENEQVTTTRSAEAGSPMGQPGFEWHVEP
jgi:hypothetical protein